MQLSLLRAFVAVAEHGTIGRAADELDLSQPALTKRLHALEREVGGRLFDRGRHGAAITGLGELLLPDARDLLRRAEAFTRRSAQAAAGTTGRLTVGFGLSAIALAPHAVAAYRDAYPHVDVVLDDLPSNVQIDRLHSGELDVGFLRTPPGHGLHHHTLATDRLALATPPGTTVQAASGAELTARMQGQPLVALRRPRGPGLAAQIDRLCQAMDARPHIAQEAHDLQTVLALVAAGVGEAIVPASAAAIAPDTVSVTPVRHRAATWQLGAVWNAERLTPTARNFLSVLGAARARTKP